MESKVDLFFENQSNWSEELNKLREIINRCGLEEEYKWGGPAYTFQGKNVIGMRGFKKHVAIWFYNGVFLQDDHKRLMSPGESTQSLRQMRFTSLAEISMAEKIIQEYTFEAIEVEKAGLKIPPKRDTIFAIPEELEKAFKSSDKLRPAFDGLTPGRQKEYALYIGEAKQERTRLTRLEKCVPLILKGIGLNDK